MAPETETDTGVVTNQWNCHYLHYSQWFFLVKGEMTLDSVYVGRISS